jgi:tetratricopeptide (TPR) repeat protein
MPRRRTECASCHKVVEADSAFCRHCGRPPSNVSAERQSLLARTADFYPFDNVNGALEACNAYMDRWADSPEIRDVLFARQCMGFLMQLEDLPALELPYEDQAQLAGAIGQGVPLILANRLASAARLARPVQVSRFLRFMESALKRIAVALDAAHKQADDEAQSLLVDGESRASRKGLGNEYFLEQASIHHAAYTSGNLDAAYSGFAALRELNPHDSYLRNMLGSILTQQGKPQLALREFLYGFALDPTDAHLPGNLMRCLCGFKLYPAVIEIYRHYTQLGGDPAESSIRPWAALARACAAAAGAKSIGCDAADFSPKAPDLIDDVVYPDHPWMPAYLFNVKEVLANVRVFISYRRAGGAECARRVERAMRDRFPRVHVFRDESSLLTGREFTTQLSDEIERADVFLALLDSDWTGSRKTGRSRLLDAKDIVRQEIAHALRIDRVVVVPVLIDDAKMPPRAEFPDEISGFALRHAPTLDQARFEESLQFVLGEIVKTLSDLELRKRADATRLQRLEALEEIDPEAAEKLRQEVFGPALAALPRFFEGTSKDGKGVPLGAIEWDGTWECTATAPTSQITLRFEAENAPRSPFRGRVLSSQGGRKTDEEIRGTWMTVLDLDKSVLLGLVLDGHRAGTPFKARIPFDRLVGRDIMGTDESGATYVSRKLS